MVIKDGSTSFKVLQDSAGIALVSTLALGIRQYHASICSYSMFTIVYSMFRYVWIIESVLVKSLHAAAWQAFSASTTSSKESIRIGSSWQKFAPICLT